MKIQIVTTSIETKPTTKGSYQQLEVVYKNLSFQGKVESKKLMSFGAGAPSFTTLSTAAAGSIFEIAVVKNDKGYNDWTSATASHADVTGASGPNPTIGKPSSTTTPRSTYETPEERAQRQILIVRQSSVSSAVSLLGVGAKAPLKVEDVLATAKKLEGYVFGLDKGQEAPKGETGFEDIPDFEGEVT